MSDGPGPFENVYDAHVLGIYRFIYARVPGQRSRAWRSSGSYRGDAQAYPIELPDLVRPRISVEGGVVYVWTAQA